MKIVQESIFSSSLRAFFVTLFGMIGIIVGLVLLVVILAAIISSGDDKSSFDSNVKILADAKGNRETLSKDTPVILQINITGEIGTDELNAKKFNEVLLDSREDSFKDNRVKGILLVIDSPGGGVNDSDIIYRMILDYKKEHNVPVFVYVNGLCASGGYYIACAADKIYASDVSLIGSIGVLSWPPFFNVTEIMKKIGVEGLTLSAGKGKDELNPTRPWKEGESDSYQKLLNFYYQRFVSIVTDARQNLSKEELINSYGAHVFPAHEALEKGYIDVAGAERKDALNELVEAAGIEKDAEYQVVSFETENWFKKLIKGNTPFFPTTVKHKIELPGSLEITSKNPCLYLYR